MELQLVADFSILLYSARTRSLLRWKTLHSIAIEDFFATYHQAKTAPTLNNNFTSGRPWSFHRWDYNPARGCPRDSDRNRTDGVRFSIESSPNMRTLNNSISCDSRGHGELHLLASSHCSTGGDCTHIWARVNDNMRGRAAPEIQQNCRQGCAAMLCYTAEQTGTAYDARSRRTGIWWC